MMLLGDVWVVVGASRSVKHVECIAREFLRNCAALNVCKPWLTLP